MEKIIADLQATKDQLGPSDTEILVLKQFSENIVPEKAVLKIDKTNIGNAFTVGHATNGIVGTANGVGGGQITIGVGDIGATSTELVFSDSDTFTDALRDETFIDTDETSATIDTANYRIDF